MADDSEVVFGQQEEIAGAREMEGSSQNRRDEGTWLEDTEPYRGARPRIRDFDRPVDRDLGATLGDGGRGGHITCGDVGRDCGSDAARLRGTAVRKSFSENTKDRKISTYSQAGGADDHESALV